MGTSSQSGGPNSGTPLVPSWLEEQPGAPAQPGQPLDQPDNNQPGEQVAPPENRPTTTPVQLPDHPHRFSLPRGNFSRFSSSGGRDTRSMRRAISGYVRTGTGGARNATMRMGSAVSTAGRVASLISSLQSSGVGPTLQRLNLSHLATRPLNEVLLGMTDALCPPGGPIDEGIARAAWIETIADVTEQGLTSFETLTPDQLEEIFIVYVSNSIEGRIFQDIGVNGIARAEDLNALNHLENALHDYICGSVRDAFHNARQETSLSNMGRDDIDRIVETTYRNAWSILEAYEDET